MSAQVFYQNAAELATLTNVFTVGVSATDPTAVSLVITDPTGTQVTHTYAGALPADITRTGTGAYTLDVPCVTAGLWSYVWIGTGAASDVQPGTWTVMPVSSLGRYYTSAEELKDRMAITGSASDTSVVLAVQAAARWVEGHCGRYFWQGAETRTYVPYAIDELPLDDLVSVTSFKIDRDGDGVFEEAWTQDTDYALTVAPGEFNQLPSGEARPYTGARVVQAGRLFPFVWPFSPANRIQVTGTFGWPAVPPAVKTATLQLAADFYKLKEAPFGVVGFGDFGLVKVRENPFVWSLLTPYISPRRKVGV